MKKVLANLPIFLTIVFVCFLIGLMVGKGKGDTIPMHDAYTLQPISKTDAAGEKLNLNTATAQELADLPGIGEDLAQRIIAYRNEMGRFYTIYELESISGIGDKKIAALKDLVYVD